LETQLEFHLKKNVSFSISSYLYLMIYDYMLTQYLNKTYSQASSAGLNVYSDSAKKYFTLQFNGYNDKMTEFIDTVSKSIKTYNENLEQSLFDTIKAQSKKRYFNSLLDSDDLNDEFLKEVLNDDYYHNFELYKEIDNIAFENLQKFVPKFFRMMKIKVLIQGNVTKNQALAIGNILKTNFACEPLDDAKYELKTRCYQMPLGTSVLRAKSLRLKDDNSNIKNYYQIGLNNFHNRNLTQLIASFLSPKCFDYLRNKEQLGYSVGCSFDETKGVLGIIVHVSSQEHKHSHAKVLQKMDIFMNEIAKAAIQNISDEEFESFKQSRVKMLVADHVKLSDEVQRNWNEIRDQDYVFNRAELSAKVTKSLTKDDFQQFFESFTKPENTRRLSVQVIGNQQIDGVLEGNDSDRVLKVEFMVEKLTEDENLIGEDIKDFQKNKYLHPVVKFEIE
jgi:nardilysin